MKAKLGVKKDLFVRSTVSKEEKEAKEDARNGVLRKTVKNVLKISNV